MNRSKIFFKLRERLWPRTTMGWILAATVAIGVVAGKLLLMAGVDNPMWRYAMVVCLSYAMFFVFIYLWLRYHFGHRMKSQSSSLDGADAVDAFDLLTIPTGPREIGWSGGGGGFSGGGASGSWSEAAESSGELDSTLSSGDGSSSAGKGLLESAGAADLDEGAFVVLLIALLAAVFGSAAYLIYQAPEILIEAAFEVALAAGLFRKAKSMQSDGWAYPVFRRTWFIFAGVLVCAAAFGFGVKHVCPQASTYAQAKQLCLK